MSANAKLHKFRQGETVSTAEYYQEFTMLLKSAENTGVNYSTPGMNQYASTEFLKKDYTTLLPDEKMQAREASREAYIAILFMHNADKTKYEKYQEDCHNSFL